MKQAAALLAATTMVLAGCGGVADDPGGGIGDAIAVHGDWTIDIYHEDGTLDEHLEFSNALTGGAEILAILLAGQSPDGQSTQPYVSSWGILFGVAPGPGGTDPCDTQVTGISDNPDLDFACLIDTPSVSIGAGGDSVVLSGSTQATQDGAFINWVETVVSGVFNDSPNTFPIFGGSFTGTAIPEQSVSAGQTVQVEVEISFTTG